MNEAIEHGEDISSLSVEQLLGLLNSPQINIADEVRSLIKGQFSIVSDRWLVHGLMDYFFLTSSKRILDLLLTAPEPHDKYLLERLSDGIKGGDRFRHFSLLLYAVSRSPPPAWVHKPHIHNVISNMLLVLKPNPKRESDVSELVSGVMIIVVLLPVIPLQLYKHISKIFECFWVLVHWIPNKDHDDVLKLHLQVAVYSLFHRLYALYPCNFLSFLRIQTVGQPRKAWFINTLRPMLDRVRLHPLLISETKETECNKSRWLGLEPSDLIHECAKLCLDPLQDICEDTNHKGTTNSPLPLGTLPDSGIFVKSSSESFFWSPGVVQSPSSGTASVPHTPVYSTYHILSNQSTGIGIAESPPETAIEATPETTPFTSPLPRVSPSPLKFEKRFKKSGAAAAKTNVKINLTHSLDLCQGNSNLSPLLKERLVPQFIEKDSKASILKENPNIILTKLQQIQQERENNIDCEIQPNIRQQPMQNKDDRKNISDDTKLECRRRKAAVYIHYNANDDMQQDLFSEVDDDKYESNLDDKLESGQGESYADKEEANINLGSFNSDDDGLMAPSRQSITELVKNVNTKRLRFLSQCGPPPNIAFLTNEAHKVEKPSLVCGLRQRCRSFPLLFNETSNIPKRDNALSSLTISPSKPSVQTIEVSTQTEEIPIINPYEQLLEVLALPSQTAAQGSKLPDKPNACDSPYMLLDQYLEFGRMGYPLPYLELGWNSLQGSNDAEKIQLRVMHSLIVLERHKREMHAERNRRLLGQIKRLHLLQEKDRSLSKEKVCLKDEISLMENNIQKLQEKIYAYENLSDQMVEKKTFLDLLVKDQKACQQREHLRQRCGSLKEENASLAKELESCRAKVHDMQRRLSIHSKQAVENESLRKQVTSLNKKIVLMGEIQNEMRTQMNDLKARNKRASLSHHNHLLKDLLQKMEQLEIKNRNDVTSLDATMLFTKQLENKLKLKQKDIDNHKKESGKLSEMWQERCNVLEKRNKELHSINISLESQMHQLLIYRPEREGEEGAESRRMVAPTGQGFPPPPRPQQFLENPVETQNLFISQATNDIFRPISSPTPEVE